MLTLFALVCMSASALDAQPRKGMGQHMGRCMERGMHGDACMLAPKLDCLKLTDAQKEQVKALHEKFRPEMELKTSAARDAQQAFREANRNHETTPEALKALHQKAADARFAKIVLRKEMMASVQSLLTPEQKAQWDAKRADRKGVGKGEHSGRAHKGCVNGSAR